MLIIELVVLVLPLPVAWLPSLMGLPLASPNIFLPLFKGEVNTSSDTNIICSTCQTGFTKAHTHLFSQASISFSGKIEIDTQTPEPIKQVWFNGD